MRVLLVEDDDTIASPLVRGLERDGFAVAHAETGQDARRAFAAAPPDVVLLDLGLPDIDGFELCRELRHDSGVPIIVVTARGEEVDRVVGLELGADDYVVKPFGFRELVARIRAVARRGTTHHGDAAPTGPLEVDRRTRRALVDGSSRSRRRSSTGSCACASRTSRPTVQTIEPRTRRRPPSPTSAACTSRRRSTKSPCAATRAGSTRCSTTS